MTSQPSLRRLEQFNITPNRELGQNFLIDSNILAVIESHADLKPADVILEVGGGLGVLSEYIADRVAYLHVVEVDRKLEPALNDAIGSHTNVSLHLNDIVSLDLHALDPSPTKLVANLPYGVAATTILRTVTELPELKTWVAMVQREVGERFAADAGSRTYGVPSVLAQLSCDVRIVRTLSRKIFYPEPNVDSVLLSLTRHSPPADEQLRNLVRDGFAHRRKTLASSVALATNDKAQRDSIRGALIELGKSASTRAEALSPQEWVQLSQLLRAGEPGKIADRTDADRGPGLTEDVS